MCRAAGFRKVQIQSHPRPARLRRLQMFRRRLQSLLRLSPRKDAGIYHYRLVAHAYK